VRAHFLDYKPLGCRRLAIAITFDTADMCRTPVASYRRRLSGIIRRLG
jgi:hypothetical protein